MSDGEKRKLQLSREDSLRALPVLAALLLVLGGWLLYAGIQRMIVMRELHAARRRLPRIGRRPLARAALPEQLHHVGDLLLADAGAELVVQLVA